MNEQIEAVQRMQEYIEGHLEEELTLTELSEVSLYSPWHSYRLFKNYLRQLRRNIFGNCVFPVPLCV